MEKSFELTELEREFDALTSVVHGTTFEAFKLGQLVVKASKVLFGGEVTYFYDKLYDRLDLLIKEEYKNET